MSSRIERNPIPKGAKAARNLRQRINRALKGAHPYDRRSPISIRFHSGITDSLSISNLPDDKREEIARMAGGWDYEYKGYVWRANVCTCIITPPDSPLKVHPVVLEIGFTIAACPLSACAIAKDPRIKKHVDFLKYLLERRQEMAA